MAVAAAEAYDAALGLDPMGRLLCIRRLSLLAATSLLFGHGGVGGTSLLHNGVISISLSFLLSCYEIGSEKARRIDMCFPSSFR